MLDASSSQNIIRIPRGDITASLLSNPGYFTALQYPAPCAVPSLYWVIEEEVERTTSVFDRIDGNQTRAPDPSGNTASAVV